MKEKTKEELFKSNEEKRKKKHLLEILTRERSERKKDCPKLLKKVEKRFLINIED